MKIPCIFLVCLCFAACCFGCNKKEWMLDAISRILCKKDNYVKERVVFSANLDSNYITKGNDHLVFSKVIVNEGNDFDHTTGTFTCQVPGLYQFSWIVHQTSGGVGLDIQLMRNKNVMFTMYLKHSNGNLPGTTYLKLKSDDTVWLRAVHAGRKLHGSDYTSFSGMLM